MGLYGAEGERERVSERDVLFGRRGGDDAARMHGK